jgi:hypothetical protein
VASRTIEAGEIILKETPLTFGPEGRTPVCLGCYQIVTRNSPSCEKCGVPVCSQACADSEFHKTFECEVFMKNECFKDSRLKNLLFKSPQLFYAMVMTLRTFLLREKDPERWALIWNLESHTGEHDQSVLAFVAYVVELLQITIGLLDEDIPTITTIFGIHLVNQWATINVGIFKNQEDSTSGEPMAVLFALASLPRHDCLNNTSSNIISSPNEGFVMTFKALRTIKEGEQVTVSYANPWSTVLERQLGFAMKKFVVRLFLFSQTKVHLSLHLNRTKIRTLYKFI